MKRKNPVAIGAILGGFVGAIGGACIGTVLSQYAPVFGRGLEWHLAEPWSEHRLSVIPGHAIMGMVAGLLVFSLVGAAVAYLCD